MPERPATPPAKAMRWLVAGIVAPALAWMLAASVSHWRDSSSGAALGEQLKLRPDHLLAQRRPVGRPWNDAGNYVFTGHRPVSFFVEPPRRAEKVDIGLDGDDQYRIMLKSDHGSTEHLVNPEFQWGIRSHVLEAPPGELEQIRVVPIQGDGHFAVGHVVLRSTGR